MFWFSKKRKQGEQLLENTTDIHCHLLAGVDDGFGSLSNSYNLLSIEETVGVKRIYLTPHSMGKEGAAVDPKTSSSSELHQEWEAAYANFEQSEQGRLFADEPKGGFSNAHLKAKFEKYKEYYTGSIELRLAAEYMMNHDFLQKVKEKDLLTYSDGKHILVETSYFFPPLEMDEILYTLSVEGYRPIIAHPERYRYMEKEQYKALKDKGYEFQLNYLSLTGYYGENVFERAIDLLDKGWYNFTGSDFHRLSTFDHTMPHLKLNNKHTTKLLELFSNNDNL